MELASKYAPESVEGKWYKYWLEHDLFSSKPDGREPYTVVIPPPNVTGVLHMGHMLNEDYPGHSGTPCPHGGKKMPVGFRAPIMPPLPPRPKS